MLYTRNKPHKRKPNWRNILLTVFCLAVVGVCIGLLCKVLPAWTGKPSPSETPVQMSGETQTPAPSDEQSAEPTQTPEAQQSAVPTETPAPKRGSGVESITLGAVGGIVLNDQELQAAQSGNAYDFSAFFSRITPYLSWQDVLIGNLDTTIGTKGYDATTAPAALLTALRDSGVDLLTLANAQILDKDIAGAQATVSAVKEAGMLSTGAYTSGADYLQPLIVEKDDLRIAVLNYTEATDKTPDGAADTVKYLTETAFTSDMNQIKADPVGVDFVVVCVHWGDEDSKELTESQKTWTQTFADAGVDVVLGTGSQYMQGMSLVQSASGSKMLVAYSLGNFLSPFRSNGRDAGVILNFTLTKDFDNDTKSIDAVTYTPTWTLKYSAAGKYSFEVLSPIEYSTKKYQNMSLADRDRVKLIQSEVTAALGTGAGSVDTSIRTMVDGVSTVSE